MVKTNVKRLVAVLMATTMIAGSSVTAFAEASTNEGTGTYEGNDVSYGAATSVTVPTAPTTGFGYIADPNGLIRQSSSSHYEKATWSNTASGIFFKTSGSDSDGYYYSEKSADIKVTNLNAAPIVVEASIAKKDGDSSSVVFTDNKEFKDAQGAVTTTRAVYFALTDGTEDNTAAVKAGGAAVTLSMTIPGKPSNYELKYSNSGYAYALKSGITTDDATKWNSKTFYAEGYLNENAEWTGESSATTPPAITITYDVKAGAAPIKIEAGKSASGTLSVKKAATVSKVYVGSTELKATDHWTATAATTEAASVLTLTAAATSIAYSKLPADGIGVTVEYNTGDKEIVYLVKKFNQ